MIYNKNLIVKNSLIRMGILSMVSTLFCLSSINNIHASTTSFYLLFSSSFVSITYIFFLQIMYEMCGEVLQLRHFYNMSIYSYISFTLGSLLYCSETMSMCNGDDHVHGRPFVGMLYITNTIFLYYLTLKTYWNWFKKMFDLKCE